MNRIISLALALWAGTAGLALLMPEKDGPHFSAAASVKKVTAMVFGSGHHQAAPTRPPL